jgi:HK97 family phage prohead protease
MLRSQGPQTIDYDNLSVEVTAVTSDAIEMWDWMQGAYNEVLLLEGVKIPKNKQVPLLDSHDRFSVDKLLGSFREIRNEGGKRLAGKVYFSATEEGQKAFKKMAEGHLTDFSVGYIVREYEEVKSGKTTTISGREFEGPCLVVTAWELHELSICAIGADPGAKVRSKDIMTAEELKARAEEEEKAKAKEKSEDEEVEETKSEEEEEEKEEETEEEEKKTKKPAKGKKSFDVLVERKRAADISDMCRTMDLGDDMARDMITRGITMDQARAEAMKLMSKRYNKGSDLNIKIVKDETAEFRKRFVDGLLLKCGASVEKPAAGSEDLSYRTLTQLAAECLRSKGIRPDMTNTYKMVERAITTSDLPLLLEESTQRYLIQGFKEAQETWPRWTGETSVQNFKPEKLIDAEVDNQLKEIYQHGEYEYVYMDEDVEEISIKTYGLKFALTRYSIINDDLGALTRVPAKLGAGVPRHIGDSVYGVLTSNPDMSDGKPLFSADHSNVVNAGNGTPTVETISQAILKMGTQTDRHGRLLSIQPVYFIAPLALYAAAETFFNTEMIGTEALPTTRNIFFGRFNRVYDARLDKRSPTTWYLVGEKDMGVLVVYLRGLKEPFVEYRPGFNIDGIEYKVRFDYGVKAVSWKNFVQVNAAV